MKNGNKIEGTPSLERYSRQMVLPEIGRAGQERISQGHIAVVGLGATGGMIAELLARAGVGHITLIDRDTVELSNLQRQVLYCEDDLGLAKADAAAVRLTNVNSGIELEPVAQDLHSGNIGDILGDVTLIMDGTDNVQTRFLINDYAVKNTIPWIYSGALGTCGMEMPILPGITPCLRCFMRVMPPAGSLPTCDMAGVLNTATSIISSVAVTDALRILTGKIEKNPGTGTLTIFDPWEKAFSQVTVNREKNCTTCQKQEYEYLSLRIRELATSLCGSGSVQIHPVRPMEIGLVSLAERLRPLGEVTTSRHMIRFKTGETELSIFEDGRAIVRGVRNAAAARALYARYIGE